MLPRHARACRGYLRLSSPIDASEKAMAVHQHLAGATLAVAAATRATGISRSWELFVPSCLVATRLASKEAGMLLQDFSDRAEEFIRLSQRARSSHDRDFLIEMA